MPKSKPLTLHVWHDTCDPTVGYFGDHATVTLEYAPDPVDKDYLQAARDTLQKAFQNFWDTSRVYVQTDQEYNAMCQAQSEEI